MKGNRVIFLKGFKTILRPVRKETDSETCTRWFNDPDVRQFLGMGGMPMSLAEENEWMEQVHKRPNDMILAIETLDGRHIGNIGLYRINWIHGTATSGTAIGEKEFWGKGYGTDAKMVLLNHAFNCLGLRKICSSVFAFNKRSINYSLKCGYKIEGIRKKQVFKNGKIHDEVLLAVYKGTFEKAWKDYQKKMRKHKIK